MMSTFKRHRKNVVFVGGAKTISTLAAHVYLLNQMLNCLPALPYLILAAGWLPTLLANVFVCLIASFTALMTMRSMTIIEGNQNFQQRYEYIAIAQHYLGPYIALSLELGFHLLQILNFLDINNVARLLDLIVIRVVGYSVGLTVHPRVSTVTAENGQLEVLYSTTLAEGGQSVPALSVSLGYVLCAGVCIPLTRYNLADGLSAQLAIFGVAIVAIVMVLSAALFRLISSLSFYAVLFSLTPAWICKIPNLFRRIRHPSHNDSLLWMLSQLVGVDPTLLLGLEQGMASLLDTTKLASEMKTSSYFQNCGRCASDLCWAVAANHNICPVAMNPLVGSMLQAVWRRQLIGFPPTLPRRLGRRQFHKTFGSLIKGYSIANMIPSWANELQSNVQIPTVLWRSTLSACGLFFVFGWVLASAFPDISEEDALLHILGHHPVPAYISFFVYSLELIAVVLGVVVSCVATRYNLTNSGMFEPSTAFLLGCVSPFLFAWIFAVESFTTEVFAWVSLILALVCNFVVPAYVYIVACQTSPLAYRNPNRYCAVRLDIKAFAPQRGTVEDVQMALREWASAMTSRVPELRALLATTDEDVSSNSSCRGRSFSGDASSMEQLERKRKISCHSSDHMRGCGGSEMTPRSSLVLAVPNDPYFTRTNSSINEVLRKLQEKYSIADIIASHRRNFASSSSTKSEVVS